GRWQELGAEWWNVRGLCVATLNVIPSEARDLLLAASVTEPLLSRTGPLIELPFGRPRRTGRDTAPTPAARPPHPAPSPSGRACCTWCSRDRCRAQMLSTCERSRHSHPCRTRSPPRARDRHSPFDSYRSLTWT